MSSIDQVKIDRRKLKRSTVKPRIAAAYAAGAAVKNIVVDFGLHDRGTLYRALAEFGIPLRDPTRSAAIKAAVAQLASAP